MHCTCVVINKKDTVATVTSAAKKGDEIKFAIDGEPKSVIAVSDIPVYHKVALTDIKKGDIVIKYGCKIGYALEDIKAGEHVHTWNLDSKMK